MNWSKTIIWFSSSSPSYQRSSICSSLGVLATTSLGRYLGVPILHQRVCKTTYQYLVDKVRHKLASWKIRTLSRTTRLVLIKSTLLAIPLYTMQLVAIPKCILNEIGKLCRAFFWGEVGGQRKLHSQIRNSLLPKGERWIRDDVSA